VQKALVARNASLLISERIAGLSLWVEGKQARPQRSGHQLAELGSPAKHFRENLRMSTCGW